MKPNARFARHRLDAEHFASPQIVGVHEGQGRARQRDRNMAAILARAGA